MMWIEQVSTRIKRQLSKRTTDADTSSAPSDAKALQHVSNAQVGIVDLGGLGTQLTKDTQHRWIGCVSV